MMFTGIIHSSGVIESLEKLEAGARLRIRASTDEPFERGESVAVDGISLTIVEPDGSSFAAALIPETLRRTTLGTARIGDRVNLEFDMIAKYVRTLVAPYLAARP